MEYRRETRIGDRSEEIVVEGSCFETLEILHFEWKRDVLNSVTNNTTFADSKATTDDIARAISRIMSDKRR